MTSDNEALLYEKTLTTTVNTLQPYAILEGVSKSGTDDDLVLSAAESYDPNRDVNGISYVWTCHDVCDLYIAISNIHLTNAFIFYYILPSETSDLQRNLFLNQKNVNLMF